ncbi:MAG: AAA family ATPase [Eubacteriales bacterium]|nr:AAA family ATPase [Eubacteriales bacterium]
MEINHWYTGTELLKFIRESEEAQKEKKRFCYKSLMGFLLTKGKDICALSGIRRTGKTVLILQAINDLIQTYHIEAKRISYITIGEKNDIDDQKLLSMIDQFAAQGIKYVFVDEISYLDMEMEDNCLNLLADRLAKAGMKIVIAGTFSYAIKLLAKETLFDRMKQIDTTYFSFKEAHEVFGQDIDTFIKYGGVINFDEDEKKMTPSDYMETAVVQNIVKSIFKSEKKYDLLLTLPEKLKKGKSEEESKAIIASLIRITIDNYMKALVVGKLINKPVYKFSDIGKLSNVIRQRSEQENVQDEMLDVINLDSKHYYQVLADYLGNSKQVPIETFQNIIKILEEISVKQDIYLEDGNVSVFVPNYLRYGLCDRIIKIIAEEVREETGARYDAALAGEILMGSIQEAICYLDLKRANHVDFDMYRSMDGSCEIDLIIRDKEKKQMALYELKHSDKQVDEQAKHLVNREFVREVEQNLGCVVSRYHVLYNGPKKTVTINPAELYQELEERSMELGKIGNAEKWERLAQSARVQKWEPVKVQYENMTEFLCGLPIVQ